METLSHAGRALEDLTVRPGYAALGDAFAERRDPTPLPDPYLVAFNARAAALLDLSPDEARRPEFLRLAAGNARFDSVPSSAAIYAGHQFGAFVPQLGDGRAIALGEVVTARGDRYEWQLKGAGMTAFSRFGDGRAVLRSTVREYLCSEAMQALGIPTTRALAIAGSQEPVHRETLETAAVLSRIAPSHVRFGSFELFHYRAQFAHVETLANYVIERFYPELLAHEPRERYARFLQEVTERTARLLAQWQAFGFAHGVMNTDNMSILGLTLDYGPFGFLEAYDPGFICNHTDAGGRYAFEQQPTVALWNCHALAAALGSLVTKSDAAPALAAFEPAYRESFRTLLRGKFGFEASRDDDVRLFSDALDLLAADRVDYTTFFRTLSSLTTASTQGDDALAQLFTDRDAWYDWQRRYRERLAYEPRDDAARQACMRGANPKYVLRNHLAQTAIEAAQRAGFGEIERLARILETPFDDQPVDERYALPAPADAPVVEVSCSS